MMRNFTKIIIKNNIRIYLSDLTDIVNQIFNYHNYSPLPNLIIANAIVAFSPLKFLYQLNDMMIRLKSNGAINSLIFEIKNNNIRSLISNPNITTEYDKNKYNSIPLILGLGDEGTFEMTRKIKGEFFNSKTQMVKFDIVTDLAYFLNKSDQIFSAVINDVWLNEKNPNQVLRAKNIIFQLLPDHNEKDKKWIEDFVSKYKLSENSILDIEKYIDGKLLKIEQIDGSCWCNKNKTINAIKLINKEEIEEIYKEKEEIEIICEFCSTKYLIKKKEIV